MAKKKKKNEEASRISISVGGNVEGEINAADGDMYIDKSVGGDQITVGDVKDSTGIAIGRGAQATVSQDNINLTQVFNEIVSQLEALPDTAGIAQEDIDDAKADLKELKEELIKKGEQAGESFLERRFRNLGRMAPAILDVATATLANPGAGFAKVVQLVAA